MLLTQPSILSCVFLWWESWGNWEPHKLFQVKRLEDGRARIWTWARWSQGPLFNSVPKRISFLGKSTKGWVALKSQLVTRKLRGIRSLNERIGTDWDEKQSRAGTTPQRSYLDRNVPKLTNFFSWSTRSLSGGWGLADATWLLDCCLVDRTGMKVCFQPPSAPVNLVL